MRKEDAVGLCWVDAGSMGEEDSNSRRQETGGGQAALEMQLMPVKMGQEIGDTRVRLKRRMTRLLERGQPLGVCKTGVAGREKERFWCGRNGGADRCG